MYGRANESSYPGHMKIVRRLIATAVELNLNEVQVFLSSNNKDEKKPLICEEDKKLFLEKMSVKSFEKVYSNYLLPGEARKLFFSIKFGMDKFHAEFVAKKPEGAKPVRYSRRKRPSPTGSPGKSARKSPSPSRSSPKPSPKSSPKSSPTSELALPIPPPGSPTSHQKRRKRTLKN